MSRRVAVALVAAATLFAAAPARAELAEPVAITAETPATVAINVPFKLTVAVKAEAGALDIATPPLRLRVRAEPECGGSFAGTEGPTLIDRVLKPPATGAGYALDVVADVKLGQLGETTICAFLEDGQERQFATDVEETVTVIPGCGATTQALNKLRKRLTKTNRHLAQVRKRARHADGGRKRALRKRQHRLAKQRHELLRKVHKARGEAKLACASARPRGRVLGASASAAGPAHIKHFFVILLENENAEDTFSAQPPAPYLGTTMRQDGVYLPNYFGIGHQSLDNYIALISGQPPNLATQSDCLLFTDFRSLSYEANGVAVGQGCVYPTAVQTVANQLEQSGQTWREYAQDMASSVDQGEPGTCRHPILNDRDTTQGARPTDQYAARHTPFVYFHSIIDYPTCQQNVVDLEVLRQDLRSEATTPAYSFITPDLCADGHDSSCADLYSPGGFDGINTFLGRWVPLIEASPAYRDHGAIMVTFDESETGAQACCNEPIGPNTLNNGGPQPGNGGGRIGAVLVSPCIKPGTVSQSQYNHYSTLRWVEDNFGLAHLGNAGGAGLAPLGGDVFNQPDCPEPSDVEARSETKTELRVRPLQATQGRKRVFRFRLISDLPECRDGVLVSFAGKQARTNARGKAHLKARLRKLGLHTAVARPEGCKVARTRVRIMPRHGH